MATQIEQSPELGTEVPLSQVDKELKKFFSSEETVTRASLMNFAIYSEQPKCLQRNTALIREVTREHACRALLVAVEPGVEKLNVRSWITAHCNLVSGARKSICSEQVSFLIQGTSPYLVSNTVFSRLDSDLPLVLWWQGEFSGNFEPNLYSRVDRLIIDSGEWANPLEQFERLEKAWSEKTSHFNVMDLAWTRVLQLRRALSFCFDEPAALAELPQVNEVEIVHSQTNSLDARMYAAWIAHQAGWKWIGAVEGSREHFNFESKEGVGISVKFTADAGNIPVSKVRLSSPSITCEVLREEGGQFIRSQVTGSNVSVEHLSPSNINTPAELIIERLRRGCNNQLYFTLLKTVRLLIS